MFLELPPGGLAWQDEVRTRAVETWLLVDRDLVPQALDPVIVVLQPPKPLRCRHVVDVCRALSGRI